MFTKLYHIIIALMLACAPLQARTNTYSFGLGWNLGNQLDAHVNGVANETSWGNRMATQQTFDSLSAMGFTSVRIPVTWLGHVGEAPTYTIDSAWMDRVEEVVNYAEKAGLKAIINIHHDGAESRFWLDVKNAAKDESLNQRIKAQLHAMWTQIAERFKKKGHFLVFEVFNEVHDGKWGGGENRTDGGRQYQVINEWNQLFVDAVRATGGKNRKRYLGVAGYCTNIELTVNHFRIPKDKVKNRLLLSVHYYHPVDFTLENRVDEWGHRAPKNQGKYVDEQHVDETFRLLKTHYVDKGIPVYVGEFGCTCRVNPADEHYRKEYLHYVVNSATRHGLSLFYWDNGSPGAGRECSGIINHSTGAHIGSGADIVHVMMEAYDNDISPFE